jgi:hypothetical protein
MSVKWDVKINKAVSWVGLVSSEHSCNIRLVSNEATNKLVKILLPSRQVYQTRCCYFVESLLLYLG